MSDFSPSLRVAIAGCSECRSDGTTPVDLADLCSIHLTEAHDEIRGAGRLSPAAAGGPEQLDELVARALQSPEQRRDLLAAIRRQRRALDGVWEAWRRGVAYLPDSVALDVERAIVHPPRLLVGGDQS